MRSMVVLRVIRHPAEVLDGRVEGAVIEAMAAAFVPGSPGDLKGNQAADGAEFVQARIEATVAGRMGSGEFRQVVVGGQEHRVGDAAGLADEHAEASRVTDS